MRAFFPSLLLLIITNARARDSRPALLRAGDAPPSPSPSADYSLLLPPTPPPRSQRSVLLGEFTGSFLLGLAVACAGASAVHTDLAPLAPLAVASILTGSIYAFGSVSGAVFNPAVSLALHLRGRISAADAARFTAVQVLAMALAGVLGFLIYGVSAFPMVAEQSVAGYLSAGLAEVLFTFTIITVVLHLATTKQHEHNDAAGLVLGLTILGCAVCASKASSACFNPAIAFGLYLGKALVEAARPAIASGPLGAALGAAAAEAPELEVSPWQPLLFTAGPMLGALLATRLFQATLPDE